jgi:hypothetical protein
MYVGSALQDVPVREMTSSEQSRAGSSKPDISIGQESGHFYSALTFEAPL